MKLSATFDPEANGLYITFADQPVNSTQVIPDEELGMVVADYDADGNIRGLEIILNPGVLKL